MSTGRSWLRLGLLLALAGGGACSQPPERLAGTSAVVLPRRVRTRSRPPPRQTRPTVAGLLDGSVRPEDCEPEFLASAAQVVMDGIEWGTPDEDRIARLELIGRMGPAAAVVVEQVIAWGGGPDDAVCLAGWATLDAIDPDGTLRVPIFIAQSGMAGREIDAGEGLYRLGPQIVPRLLAVIEGREQGEKSTCYTALEHMGPLAAEALPVLRRKTERGSEWAATTLFHVSGGSEPEVRRLLFEMVEKSYFLDRVRAARPGLVDELAPLLRAESPTLRLQAALLLAREAPTTPGVARGLLEGVVAEDDETRRDYQRLVVGLGPLAKPVVPELVALSERIAWRELAPMLAATCDRDVALPALREAFDKSPGRALAEALVSFGSEDAERVLSVLTAAMTEKHLVYPRRRSWGRSKGPREVFAHPWAANALGELGAAAAPAIPELIRALDAGSHAVDQSIWALARIGGPAVEPLAAALQSSSSAAVRAGAARALRRIGMEAVPALLALRAALDDADPNVRGCAAAALALLRPEDPDVVAALAGALESGDRRLQGEWLQGLGPENTAALPAVRQALMHPDRTLRIQAGRAEWRITDDIQPLMEAITAALEANEGIYAALHAVVELGSLAEPALPALIRRVEEDERFDGSVADALAAIGPDAGAAAPTVARFVRSGTDWEIERACEVLAAMGPSAEAAVPALTRKLREQCTWPERKMIEALGAIGPAAAPAVPEIRKRLTDYWATTREAAREALQKIEGP